MLVTTYKNPDLDGTACAFAYAEFLQKIGVNAIAGVFGIPYHEAKFVFKKFNIKAMEDGNSLLETCKNIIIVDASDLQGIPSGINPSQVIEIVDHRKIHQADSFPNAKIHIELVGAAATLIAEKFYKENVHISKESAVLLFFAIVSNTINFQARVTTDRDVKMANWLGGQFEIPEHYIHEMFVFKSTFSKPLKQIFTEGTFATYEFNQKTVGIVQLEIIDTDGFIQRHLGEINEILSEIKREQSLDLIFLTCIDVEQGFNRLVATDTTSQELLEKALNVSFNRNLAKIERIIMRKEIVPLLKDILEHM